MSSNTAPPLLSPSHHLCVGQHHCFHLEAEAKWICSGLCQTSSGCRSFWCCHPSCLPRSSARGYQPEQAQQNRMWGGLSLSSSQSSTLFPSYSHQQFQPRCQALHRACVLCHQGQGTPALKPPELDLPGCICKRWVSGTLCKPDLASYKRHKRDCSNPRLLTNACSQAGSRSTPKLASGQDYSLWARGTPRVCTNRYWCDKVACEALKRLSFRQTLFWLFTSKSSKE